jgi:hypothetical protein
MGIARGLEAELLLAADGRPIARAQHFDVHRELALDQLHPPGTARRKSMYDDAALAQFRDVDVGILMNRYGVSPTGPRGNKVKASRFDPVGGVLPGHPRQPGRGSDHHGS